MKKLLVVAAMALTGCPEMFDMAGVGEEPAPVEMCEIHDANPAPPWKPIEVIQFWACVAQYIIEPGPGEGDMKISCPDAGDPTKIIWTIEIVGETAELVGFGWQWSYLSDSILFGRHFGVDGEEIGCICVQPEHCPAGCDPC